MSQENVEIVKRHHEAYNRHDIRAFLETLDPDVEWILNHGCAGRAHLTSPPTGRSSRHAPRSSAISVIAFFSLVTGGLGAAPAVSSWRTSPRPGCTRSKTEES